MSGRHTSKLARKAAPQLIRVLVSTVIGASAVTACGATAAASSPKTSAAAPSKAPAAPAAAIPAGYQRVGGTAQGISVAVPKSWVAMNPATESIKSAAKKLNVRGLSASTLMSDMQQIEAKHGIIVFDVHSASVNPGHFVTNLNAYCSQSGVTDTGSAGVPIIKSQIGPALQQQLHATNLSEQNVTIGGVPGLQTSFTISSGLGDISETQLDVLPKPDRACFVTLSGPHGKLPSSVISAAAETAQYP